MNISALLMLSKLAANSNRREALVAGAVRN